jgi:hypothetical protein
MIASRLKNQTVLKVKIAKAENKHVEEIRKKHKLNQ